MATQIELKTNFSFSGSVSGEVSLPSNIITIGDLLRHIGDEIKFPFINAKNGILKDDIEIVINGNDFWFYPTGLNTPLKNGDSIVVYLIALGGG